MCNFIDGHVISVTHILIAKNFLHNILFHRLKLLVLYGNYLNGETYSGKRPQTMGQNHPVPYFFKKH